MSKSIQTENNEEILRLITTQENKDWRTQFERTILENITKNLNQLTHEVSKLETILSTRLNGEIEKLIFENARKQSIENCRKIMGNIEILPNPSDIRTRN